MTIIDGRYHPWRHLADRHPEVEAVLTDDLPDDVLGLTDGRRVWLRKSASARARRSALAHEIVHLERWTKVRARPAGTAGREIEELIADQHAANRLITIPELVAALKQRPHTTLADLARRLWTDQPTVKTRLDNLDPVDLAWIEGELDLDWHVTMPAWARMQQQGPKARTA